jgi:hypothetical protein
MKQVLFVAILFMSSTANAMLPFIDMEDIVYQEYLMAVTAILESEDACTHTTGECYGVDLDYPYPFVTDYDRFIDVMSKATASHGYDSDERKVVISRVLAVSFAETTWGRYTRMGAAGECGDLQIISCNYEGWPRPVACANGPYVNANTRPTCQWLESPENSLEFFLSFWEAAGGPAGYNGCRTNDCNYAQRYDRRFNAAMTALNY